MNRNRPGYMTTDDAAEAWGKDPTSVALRCRQGRVPGAIKGYLHKHGWSDAYTSKQWLVPEWVTLDKVRGPKEARPASVLDETNAQAVGHAMDLAPQRVLAATMGFRATDLREMVLDAISELPPLERYVLVRRYGLGTQRATLRELGDELGRSRMRVRQFQREAERKIQPYLKQELAKLFGPLILEEGFSKEAKGGDR